MTAGLFVDYFGTGKLESAFHPTLQVCYMQGKLLIPPLNINPSTGSVKYQFDLPVGLKNPFIYVDRITRYSDATGFWSLQADTYLTKISENRWELTIVGIVMYQNGTKINVWTNPICREIDQVYIHYGGYRG